MLFEELESLYKKAKLSTSTRYHKESYVEGEVDYFLGLNSATISAFSKKYYKTIDFFEISKLLEHKVHEYRSIALSILCRKMLIANKDEQKTIVEFYLKEMDYINNWDLVDISAANILGKYYFDNNDYSLLYELSMSKNLWYKRIAIVASHHMIRNDIYNLTLDLTSNLIKDAHDLIHKACGWMLREVGKRDENVLTEYLANNYEIMPRTMLRYAIEKYPENVRKRILKGDFLWR
jgi:3-methyladenine DNA glycosylase AlkD